MNAPPRVSVVTSVYNEMPWLPVSIESVLSQTFTDFEFLLVDDGSKNGCPEALADYEARDSRIRVIQKENGGQVSGLNRGIAEARGEYVARLDADDMMYPTRLEKQVAYLDAHPEVALVGSQVDWAAPSGTSRWDTPTDPHVARWTLLLENCFMGGGVTFRTEVVRRLGGYREESQYAEDYDLWLRIAEVADVANLPETLAWFNNLRTTNGSTLHRQTQRDNAVREMIRAVRRYLPDADADVILDASDVGSGNGLVAPGGKRRAVDRIARAARLLCQLRDVFLLHHHVPPSAAGAVRSSTNRRLMRLRLESARLGGLGQLARLHRPRLDPNARLLQVPALLNRS